MSLLDGFENRKIDLVRCTNTKNNFGAITQTRSVVSYNMLGRIDYANGSTRNLLQGKQGRSSNTLFCDKSIDIRVGDILTNVRNIETLAVDNVSLNGSLVAAEYEVTWVSNPGSEDDHLEVSIFRIDGQTLV